MSSHSPIINSTSSPVPSNQSYFRTFIYSVAADYTTDVEHDFYSVLLLKHKNMFLCSLFQNLCFLQLCGNHWGL